MNINELHNHFSEAFPVTSERHRVDFLHITDDAETSGAFRVSLRIVNWDLTDDTRKVLDTKEQALLLKEEYANHDNFPAFLEGWSDALRKVLENDTDGRVYDCTPEDLAFFDTLALKTPSTPSDYEDKLLNTKKRLGSLIEEESP